MLRIEVEVEPLGDSGRRARFQNVVVDTDAELSWFDAATLEGIGVRRSKRMRFRKATGAIVERWTENAVVHAAGVSVPDLVVFGEPGDLTLLGARSLEGLNLIVDPVNKRLMDAGPMLGAAAA